jgi:DNA-nicking Smr family endonuclease
MKRRLTDQERRLWREVTRDVQAASQLPPLPDLPPVFLPAPTPVAPMEAILAIPGKRVRPPSLTTLFEPWHEKRLQQGTLHVEARLDLHGMTQNAAHAALIRFVLSEARAGKRLLLVITGKGRQGEGVLKQYVPFWLDAEPLRGHLLAVRPALPRHGGAGALYLLLRRSS